MTCCCNFIFVCLCPCAISVSTKPEELTNVLEICNIVFTSMFTLEMILKLTAFGFFEYLRNPYNIFDGIIVIIRSVILQTPENELPNVHRAVVALPMWLYMQMISHHSRSCIYLLYSVMKTNCLEQTCNCKIKKNWCSAFNYYRIK